MYSKFGLDVLCVLLFVTFGIMEDALALIATLFTLIVLPLKLCEQGKVMQFSSQEEP